MKKYIIDDNFVYELIYYNKEFFNIQKHYEIINVKVRFNTYYNGYSIICLVNYFANKYNVSKNVFIYRENIDKLYDNVLKKKRKEKLNILKNNKNG